MEFELIISVPHQQTRTVVLREPRLIIGTLSSNPIVVDGAGADPIHALLERQANGTWNVTDLGSTSGTLVNGQKIDVEKVLTPGDTIKIGPTTLQFSKRSATTAAPPPPPPGLGKTSSAVLSTQAISEGPVSIFESLDRESATGRRDERLKDVLFSPREARPSGDILEVVAYWGNTVLDVDLFHPRRGGYDKVTIGDPTKAHFIAAGKENLSRYTLASVSESSYELNIGEEMEARLRRKGKVEKVDRPGTVSLDRDDVAHIKLGPVRYFFCFVRPPALDLPRTGPADPFLLWMSVAATAVYLLIVPFLWVSTPKPKSEDEADIYSIVQTPEELKKPEILKEKPKPEVKLAEKKPETTPPPKAPPPPKPKPVAPAKPVEKEKPEQTKPVEKPVQQQMKQPLAPQPSAAPQQPPKPNPKSSKPAGGMESTGAAKPDMKYAGPKNNKPLGASGGQKGSGNNQKGGEIKGNKAASVQGVEGVDNNKASGVNLSKLGLGVGKVLNKTGAGAIRTNFQSSSGGAGGGMGSGAKTYGLGGVGTGKSLGLQGTAGAVNNFGSGSGGFLGGQGGSGGLGGSGGGPGFGSGSGSGAGGTGRANISIPPGDPAVSGGLTAQEIMAVIRANLNQIRHCYEQLLQRSPNSAGKIAVNWVINTSGGVMTVNVTDSSIPDPQMKGCVTGRISRWQFPKPRGNQPVVVNYPFVFNPL